MNRQQLMHNKTDDWTWQRAQHSDVEDIVAMAESHYQLEIEHILTPNPTRLGFHLHKAILEQTYSLASEFVTVARSKQDNRLIAWSWLERGKYTPYANEEMAVAEFVHTELTLPARTRIRLVAQTLESWICWCEINHIPVLCSTSIRTDQAGFMRLHDLYDFTVKGSFAYKKISWALDQ
jgi:hypothetical protein